ncbi:hypothetical protein FCM35_KLT12731 [Carex littledalei]|uniref:Uncharacterized protein n=1 Tax=Carex littledalei TaxID=544730 RepID=A0A833QQ36_9POAL|nr:hypothetical protein FCM35_KLT12731 [Carex littledalei]
MSSNSWTCEIESVADAARLFKAGILDWHNLAPKIAPQVVTLPFSFFTEPVVLDELIRSIELWVRASRKCGKSGS